MADEEVVVKLSLVDEMSSEIKAIRANMETNFGAANKKLAESKGAFASLGSEIKGNFANSIKGAVIGLAGFAVVGKVTGFLRDARIEFKENVMMQNQLRVALGYTSTSLNEQADAIAKKLVLDNEEITAVQIKLANYVKNEDQVKKLVPAVLDLAAATGMDMASAANMVARGIADDSEELGRFKISVDGAKGSTERINSVVEGLTKNFGGQAQALATSKDAFDQYGVALKNLQEGTFKNLTFAANVAFRTFSDFGRLLAGTSFKKIQEESGKYFEELKKNYNGEVDEAKNASDKKIAIANAEAARKEQLRIDNLEKYKKIKADEIKAAQEAADNSLNSYQIVRESEIALMQDGIAKEFALLDLKYETDQIKYAQNKEMLAAIDLQYANNAQLIIDTNNQKELDKKKEYNDKVTEIQSTGLQELEQKSDESFKAWVKQEQDKAKIAQQNRRDQIAGGISGAGQLFSAIAGANRRSAEEKRNIARVEAGINTAVAITKALPNPIAVALASAIGIAQQVAITNAKFATGTAYQSGGMSLVGENGPEYINLPRGASVYNNTQTRNMTTNASMNVTIMDSSGNITETLRTQIRSGQADYLVRDIQNRLARQI